MRRVLIAAPRREKWKRKKKKETKQKKQDEEEEEEDKEALPSKKAKVQKKLSKEEVSEFRSTNQITVYLPGGELDSEFVCQPTSFDIFPPKIRNAVSKFTHPTPIQSQSFPIVLERKDMVGIAKTGSGKTLAFLLPCFAHLQSKPFGKNPKVLVVSPTRELALQTAAVCDEVGSQLNIRGVAVYGLWN